MNEFVGPQLLKLLATHGNDDMPESNGTKAKVAGKCRTRSLAFAQGDFEDARRSDGSSAKQHGDGGDQNAHERAGRRPKQLHDLADAAGHSCGPVVRKEKRTQAGILDVPATEGSGRTPCPKDASILVTAKPGVKVLQSVPAMPAQARDGDADDGARQDAHTAAEQHLAAEDALGLRRFSWNGRCQ